MDVQMMDAFALARTQVFILAGGEGERLHPLTVSRTKPALSFGGMFRVIDFTLSNCLHSGVSRVSLLTQYQHEGLHRYVREGWCHLWNKTLPDRAPLACLPPLKGKRYRGTADAVFQNADVLHPDSESVLILSGDHIYQMDYRELLRQHAETNADVTIATVEHPLDQASDFGVVEVDEDFRVKGFEEKPAKPRSLPSDRSVALVSMGVYVFKKAVLLGSLRALCEPGLGYDFGHDVIPALIPSVRAYTYDFRDKTQNTPHYWRDIGTIDCYYAASMDLVQADTLFDPYANDRWPLQPTRHPAFYNSQHVAKMPPRLHSNCRVTRTVLSPGVHVREGATVDETVLMPGVRVGKGAQLRRAIVEEGIHIPAGFRAGFDLEHDSKHHTVTDGGVVVVSQIVGTAVPHVLRFAKASARGTENYGSAASVTA